MTIDLATQTEIDSVALHNPEPARVVTGRRFLYDATLTTSNGESPCASCHVFGDFDSLAWDLGNPDGLVENNTNPARPDFFHKQVGQVFGHAFLHLRTVRQHFNHTSEFAQTDDLAVGEVGNVRLAHEGQQMMFT